MAFKSIRKHFTKNEELSSIKGTYERFSIISENPNFVEIQVNGQKFWFSHQKILDFQNITINSIKFLTECDAQITYVQVFLGNVI